MHNRAVPDALIRQLATRSHPCDRSSALCDKRYNRFRCSRPRHSPTIALDRIAQDTIPSLYNKIQVVLVFDDCGAILDCLAFFDKRLHNHVHICRYSNDQTSVPRDSNPRQPQKTVMPKQHCWPLSESDYMNLMMAGIIRR